MIGPGARAVGSNLDLTADLTVEVDGSTARVTGSGHRLRIDADSPAALWAALSGAALPDAVGSVSGPRAVGRLADGLAALGLEAEINGPDGMLVKMGVPAPTRIGRALTGSGSVEFGAARALLPVGTAWLRQTGRVRAASAAAGVALGAALVTTLLRNRTHSVRRPSKPCPDIPPVSPS